MQDYVQWAVDIFLIFSFYFIYQVVWMFVQVLQFKQPH